MLSLRKIRAGTSSTSPWARALRCGAGSSSHHCRQVSSSSAAGWSWHGGPTLRVKPVALLLNLYAPWAGTGARPEVELKGRLGLFPSWPGLLPLRDPEAGASRGVGGRQDQLQKQKEGTSSPSLTLL